MTQAEKDWLRYRSHKLQKEATKNHPTQAKSQAEGTDERSETSSDRIEGLGKEQGGQQPPYGQEEGTEDEIGMAFELRVLETILR